MTTTEPQCPEPGIYEDIPFETYLQWDAISNSKLTLADRSLAHFKAGWIGEESKALRLGSLTHCGKLEPLELAKRYAVMPRFEADRANTTKDGEQSLSKATKYYQFKKKEFLEANKDKTLIESSEYDQMLGMVRSIAANPEAIRVLDGSGPVEVSIVWKDPETNLRCKARFDKLQADQGRFSDLKSTRDAKQFERHIIEFGYHRQTGFYQWGYEVLTGDKLEPWLVPVESNAPFPCRSAPVDALLVRDGMAESRILMDAVANALATNYFPSYPNPDRWFAPSWYTRSDLTKPVEVTVGGETALI